MSPGRVVSGGQSGVDRAALDAAIAAGIPYGGWCPRGGWAEDMPDPPGVLARYPQLAATPLADPEQRTRWNVRDSDATLIVTAPGAISAGTALALATVFELDRELAVLDATDPGDALADALAMLDALPEGATLNVVGPRESEAPGIYEAAVELLSGLFSDGVAARG